MISIITVCYRDPIGLMKTYQSLLKLQHDSFEWIVVNKEGSPEIEDIIRVVGFAHFKYIEGRDDGIYDAMNIGLTAANGDYVLYINAGDELVPAGLEAFLSTNAKSLDEYDLLFLQSSRASENGNDVIVTPKPSWYIYYSLPTIHQSIIYRRTDSLLKGYDANYRICGDYALTARLMKEGAKCKALPILVSRFYLGGVSSQRPELLANEAMQIQISLLGVPTIFASLMKTLRLIRLKLL
jgi:putative colanic acid biosynthesis glycosyltransferase